MSSINVIGAACIDLFVYPIDKDHFFNGKYKVDNIKTYIGGDALNETMVLKHFGLDVKLITILGNDLYGKQIINCLNENKIIYNDNILKDIDTSISIVMLENDNNHIFVGNKYGSVRMLKYEDIEIDKDCKIVSFASLFISNELNDDDLSRLFNDIKKKNIILCVDCSSPKNNEYVKDMNCLQYIDYFFCNLSEARSLCRNDDIFKCEKMLYEAGIKNVIIKADKKGALYKSKYYYTKQIDIVDSTGAGDSFVAGFIYELNNGSDIEKCLLKANYCGLNACQYYGANQWLKYVANKE